jgi:zinc and cadmium transporter
MSFIFYTFASVLAVSLISFIGLLTLAINTRRLQTVLIYLISFAAGALFGDAFLHLLPKASENGFTLGVGSSVLAGIAVFFVLEKVIHWRHCHMPPSRKHVHPFAYMNLIGDALHNFLDGIIIAASYIVSVPVGVATTTAVALHEIPQEIGDFGILVHGGFSKGKALMVNFFSALAAVLGAAVALWLTSTIDQIESILLPLAAGGFMYIAGSDLIPELHKETT